MTEASKRMYAVQVYSGSEKRVKQRLEDQIKESGFLDKFGNVYVFTEEVVEIRRSGDKRKSERKFYPGYVFIEMDMDDDTWRIVKDIPNVLNFVSGRTPIPQHEVDLMLDRVKSSSERPRPKTLYQPGELVRVIEGPFADFNGVVEEVNYDKNRLRVAVLIFGRSTPVDLEFGQVTKA
jgi:transcription termination/antitermination protein NusG